MWPLLFTAVVAGTTGLVAKHFLNHNSSTHDHSTNHEDVDDPDAEVPIHTKSDRIFRFSSSESRRGSENSRKKSGIARLRMAEQRSFGSPRGSVICFMRKRTVRRRAASHKYCLSKNSSLFGVGLGVGIMCMVSAGKDEMKKLNTTMDETARVVQELKSEVCKRKSPRNMQVLDTPSEDSRSPKTSRYDEPTKLVLNNSTTLDRDLHYMNTVDTSDGECPSSVLTEEAPVETLEMNQLEAELEQELHKLPQCRADSSCHDEFRPHLHEGHVEGLGFYEHEGQQVSASYQCGGISPSELNEKLRHLQIEQQENQIVELEADLHLAQSKLLQKEAELEALKDCIRRLTRFSLSTVSDDESEPQEERESTIGIKRAVDYETLG